MAQELTDLQLEYIEWRANPAREGSKTDWAREHGLHPGTLGRWERQAWFRQGLERRLAELNIEPDRVQAVLDALWKQAKSGDVQAAREYFKFIEDMRPKPSLEDASVASLTDEELELAWEEGLAALRRNRALA